MRVTDLRSKRLTLNFSSLVQDLRSGRTQWTALLVSTIFEIIREIHQHGSAILLIEQNVFHALSFSARGYVLENGEMALSGDAQELLENPHIRKTYLGLGLANPILSPYRTM